jgi:hypothetical protein
MMQTIQSCFCAFLNETEIENNMGPLLRLFDSLGVME